MKSPTRHDRIGRMANHRRSWGCLLPVGCFTVVATAAVVCVCGFLGLVDFRTEHQDWPEPIKVSQDRTKPIEADESPKQKSKPQSKPKNQKARLGIAYINTKPVDGKWRYFFQIKNYGKEKFEGTVKIELCR